MILNFNIKAKRKFIVYYIFFKSVAYSWKFLHHSIRNELLRTNLLIFNRNSCKISKFKVFVVFRLSAVYISFLLVRLLFYSFTWDECIFIKSSKLVIARLTAQTGKFLTHTTTSPITTLVPLNYFSGTQYTTSCPAKFYLLWCLLVLYW